VVTADAGVADAGAVGVAVVEDARFSAGPIGAAVAGTLAGTLVPGPVTAGRVSVAAGPVPVAANPSPGTTCPGRGVAYKPARTRTQASMATVASRRVGRRRRPDPATGAVAAAGGATCGVRSPVAGVRSSAGGSPAVIDGAPDPSGTPSVLAAAVSAPS